MSTVDDIEKEESSLVQRMPVGGHIKERDAYLRQHGIYEKWRSIYRMYVRLAQRGDLEALKRALFYAWYQLAEPAWLSGIGELPDSHTGIVVDLLEHRLGAGLRDAELEYMLKYYLVVCDYYLERFYPLPSIEGVSRSNIDLGRSLPSNTSMASRGRMGEYWLDK